MSRFNRFLAGIKVVDVSFYIPGPMASLQLADMGAEVIKVEPPWGDDMRSLGPRDAAGRPLFHEALNAGKTVTPAGSQIRCGARGAARSDGYGRYLHRGVSSRRDGPPGPWPG